MNKNLKSDEDSRLNSKLMFLGTNFLAGMGVCSYIGYYIDERLGKKNYYLAIGAGIGLLWVFYETFKWVYFLNRKENKKKQLDNVDPKDAKTKK